jgi:hypothetical protein
LIKHERIHWVEHDATNASRRVCSVCQESIKNREQEGLCLARTCPSGDGDSGLMIGGGVLDTFKHLDLMLVELSVLRKHLSKPSDLLYCRSTQEILRLHRRERCAASGFSWKCRLKPQIRNKSSFRSTPQPTARFGNADRLRWRSVFDRKVNHRTVNCIHGSCRI